MSSRLVCAFTALFLSAAAGCSLPASTTDDVMSSSAALSDESFRLYTDLEVDPSLGCDLHTVLTVSVPRRGDVKDPFPGGAVLYAQLREEETGECRCTVEPEPRAYWLLFDNDECGSTVYKASATTNGAAREITITDNRGRVCKDLTAVAPLVVEETATDGSVRTIYSREGSRRLPSS